MGVYYNPPADLENGIVGTKVTEGSGTDNPQDRWRHHMDIANGQNGHLYAVVDTGPFKAAQCVDQLVDFEHATATYRNGISIAYFVLTSEEHQAAA